MRLPRMRFTVREMIVAVAVVAVLTPFPFEAVFTSIAVALTVWFPLTMIGLMTCELARKAGAVTTATVSCLLAVGLLLLSPVESWEETASRAALLGLSVANGFGPLFAAYRVRRGQQLASGHILWAWVGLAWSAVLIDFHPHARVETVIAMGQFSRLSVALTVLLALYGARPAQTGAAWAHYAGWLLMECDVILWGWYAARFWW